MDHLSFTPTSRLTQSFAVGTVSCLLLSGCLGQKPSLPSFGWSQTSKSASEKTAPQEQESSPVGLAHVALNAPQNLGPAQSLSTDILQTSGQLGTAQGQPGTGNPDQTAALNEIDAAFQNLQNPTPLAQQVPATQSLDEFGAVVSAVEQGESTLSALKASLDQINQTQGTSIPQSGLEMAGAQTEQQLAPSLAAGLSEPVIQGVPEVTVPVAGAAEAFPWASSPSPSAETLSAVTTERVRQMLTKSAELIQQNNLLAARTVAESAQAMLQKTQAVLSPGEITPQQVLADIRQRQVQHEQQLQTVASLPQATVATSAAVPVVIDLSREQVNTSHGADNAKSVNEILQFAESTVLANRPASLPSIQPGPSPVLENSLTTNASPNPGSVPAFAPQMQESPSDPHVVLLGEMPADNSAQAFVLSGDEAPAREGAGNSVPQLGLESQSGPGFSSQASAPLLIAPGGQGAVLPAAEIDEFAADFADVSQLESPEIVSAPLLIDESDLQLEPPAKPLLSSTTITLLICGLAAGMVMFFRWRR